MRGLRIAAALIAALAALPANAQTYPDRPVKIVLPFGAGGVADVSSRIIAEKLGERLGQRFVIENMPGAGGIGAAKAVLSAPPDGYTLGLVTNGTAISAAIFNKLPFDPTTEFDMISTLGTFDLVFAVNAGSPHKTLADFVAAAKAAPGKLNVGTVNVGGTQHLGAELLKTAAAGIDVRMTLPFPQFARHRGRAAARRRAHDGGLSRRRERPGRRRQIARLLATSGPKRYRLHAEPRRRSRRAGMSPRATRSRRGTACSRRAARRRGWSAWSMRRSRRCWRCPT